MLPALWRCAMIQHTKDARALLQDLEIHLRNARQREAAKAVAAMARNARRDTMADCADARRQAEARFLQFTTPTIGD